MNNILTVLKKELKRFFTDRKLLITLILPGILIYAIYSIMGAAMKDKFTVDNSYEYNVWVQNEPTEGVLALKNIVPEESGIKINLKKIEDSGKDINYYKDILKDKDNKEVDLIINYVGDFSTLTSGIWTGNEPNIEIYQNSVKTESASIYSIVVESFEAFENLQANMFNVNYNVEFDMATKEDQQATFMTMLMPMLIMMLLFSGCMAVVPESIAGEKERGTIATLLITPLKRRELAIGKIISLSLVSIISATSSFIGVLLSLPKLMGDSVSLSNIYNFGEYALMFLVLIVTVILFVTVLGILSAQAKSVKESTMYTTPVMLLVMLVSMGLMFSKTSDVNLLTCLIPIYNSAAVLKSLFSMQINILSIVITIVSNIVYISIGLFSLTKMFNSERVMFNK